MDGGKGGREREKEREKGGRRDREKEREEVGREREGREARNME